MGGRGRSLVVFAGLGDAVRREAGIAVCYWWGITPQTITVWRKAMGVGPTTEGTSQLRSGYAQEDPLAQGRAKGQAKNSDPQRRAKIAAAKRGKKRPRHVIEAMRRGRKGKPQSADARRKISEGLKRSGHRPPKAGRAWTTAEDEYVRTLPPVEVVLKTGRSLQAVYDRRHELKLPDGRRNRGA